MKQQPIAQLDMTGRPYNNVEQELDEDEDKSSPQPDDDQKDFFYCEKCGSGRLELMYYDKVLQRIVVRCLTCGCFMQLLNYQTPKPRNNHRKNKHANYFG
jgi:hypothetical protein